MIKYASLCFHITVRLNYKQPRRVGCPNAPKVLSLFERFFSSNYLIFNKILAYGVWTHRDKINGVTPYNGLSALQLLYFPNNDSMTSDEACQIVKASGIFIFSLVFNTAPLEINLFFLFYKQCQSSRTLCNYWIELFRPPQYSNAQSLKKGLFSSAFNTSWCFFCTSSPYMYKEATLPT